MLGPKNIVKISCMYNLDQGNLVTREGGQLRRAKVHPGSFE